MLKKLVKAAVAIAIVVFVYQRISRTLWGSSVLSSSEMPLILKNWKPPVHFLTADLNLYDILPMYIRQRIIPKQDTTLILFSGQCPLFHPHLNRGPGYFFDRNNVDFFSTLLAGTISRVVWVYPFLRDPIQIDLPATTKYSIGTTRFYLPVSVTSAEGKNKHKSVYFHTICLCEKGQQHCSLPHLSHLAGPIPVELCSIKHTFVFSQLFDFVLESDLMTTNWLRSTPDAVAPVSIILCVEMTYFGNPSNRVTEAAQHPMDATSFDQPDDEWNVHSEGVVWRSDLLSKLVPLYKELALTSDSRTRLGVTRSLLDLAYLLLSPSFLCSKTAEELAVESLSTSRCGSSPDILWRRNASRLLPGAPNNTSNNTILPSCCTSGFHLLLQFVNLTEPTLIVEGSTRQLLLQIWLWLCTHSQSTSTMQVYQQLTLWTVCQSPHHYAAQPDQLLVLCPRQPAVAQPTGDQLALLLLFDRLHAVFRRMPQPRLVIINSGELPLAKLTRDHVSIRICRLVDSVIGNDETGLLNVSTSAF